MPEPVAMEIAFVYDAVFPYVKGGVERRIWEIALRLSGKGHRVHIIGMKWWDGNDILVKDGVILHGVCPAQHLYANGRRTVTEALRFGISLFFHFPRKKFDIIDCQQFPFFSCFPTRAIAAFRRTPLIITWHEFWGDYWYAYLGRVGVFGKGIERIVVRLTPHRIAVSKTTSAFLKKTGRVPAAVIIPNGVDQDRVAAIRPAPEPSDICFAGRLIREKHVDLLIRAFAIVSSEQPELRLRIIGEGPERQPILDLIRTLRLDNRITVSDFLPGPDDLIAQMKASKIFVIPSTREGFGIAALEALACGIPVITINHPANAIRDLITEKTGFLCALSPEDLARSIREALRRHADMREDCIAVARRYDWDHIAEGYEEYCRSVLAEKGSATKND